MHFLLSEVFVTLQVAALVRYDDIIRFLNAYAYQIKIISTKYKYWVQENPLNPRPIRRKHEDITQAIADYADSGSEDDEVEDPVFATEKLSGSSNDSDQGKKAGTRKSAEQMKKDAFEIDFISALQYLKVPCNRTCHLGGKCIYALTCKDVCDERLDFFGPVGKPAPSDRERATKIWDILQTKTRHDDSDSDNYDVDSDEQTIN